MIRSITPKFCPSIGVLVFILESFAGIIIPKISGLYCDDIALKFRHLRSRDLRVGKDLGRSFLLGALVPHRSNHKRKLG